MVRKPPRKDAYGLRDWEAVPEGTVKSSVSAIALMLHLFESGYAVGEQRSPFEVGLLGLFCAMVL